MRKLFLVAYDITGARRLRLVHKVMSGYGQKVQYSVFLCHLTDKDMVILREKLKDIINHREDQILIIEIGVADSTRRTNPDNWEILGKKLLLKDYSVMIY